MRIEISEQHLILMVSALNDSIKFNEALLTSEMTNDVSDYEEHLICLEGFQGWLEDEYSRLANENPNLPPYNKIINNQVIKFRKI